MKNTIELKIGGRYKIASGWFIIKNIDGKRVTIEYEEPKRTSELDKELIVGAVSKTYRKANIAEPHNKDVDNKLYTKTLGFMAKNSLIMALITQSDIKNFNRKFLRLLGEYPDEDSNGYCIHVGKAWSSTIRVIFKMPDGLFTNDFRFGIVNKLDIKTGSGKDELNINNIIWGFDLLSMGFNLGSKHDIEKIKSNIPRKYLTDFEEGLKIQ